MLVRFLQNAANSCKMAVTSSVEWFVAPYRAETEAHRRISVWVETAVVVISAYSCIKQPFTAINGQVCGIHLHIHLKELCDEIDTQTYGWVIEEIQGGIILQKPLQASGRGDNGAGI